MNNLLILSAMTIAYWLSGPLKAHSHITVLITKKVVSYIFFRLSSCMCHNWQQDD